MKYKINKEGTGTHKLTPKKKPKNRIGKNPGKFA